MYCTIHNIHGVTKHKLKSMSQTCATQFAYRFHEKNCFFGLSLGSQATYWSRNLDYSFWVWWCPTLVLRHPDIERQSCQLFLASRQSIIAGLITSSRSTYEAHLLAHLADSDFVMKGINGYLPKQSPANQAREKVARLPEIQCQCLWDNWLKQDLFLHVNSSSTRS